jgi:hypothetical protein
MISWTLELRSKWRWYQMGDIAIAILMVIVGVDVIGLAVWLCGVAAQGRRAMRGGRRPEYKEDEE